MGTGVDPLVGAVISARYRLVARIGSGGMGVVYRAYDLADKRYVVVKMPRRELLGEERFLQRFIQELAALRALSHESIVPIIDVGEAHGVPYAVMLYLAGGSLKQRRQLKPDGSAAPDTPASLWTWLPAIANALDFVHASGFVHRDVKPDNVLFDGLGRVYLGDFGVAKIVLQAHEGAASSGLTRTGFALGTPEYMAPELVSTSKPSAGNDQYALAVMTYEILAGHRPFDGPTPAAIMIAHAMETAAPLSRLRPALPTSVAEAVAKGLFKDPADRFASCSQFASAVLADIPPPAAAIQQQLMCPRCNRLLNVKPDWAGKHGNCPRCKSALTIAADLRSLWAQGESGGDGSAPDTATAGKFAATPSHPVPLRPNRKTSAEGDAKADRPPLHERVLSSLFFQVAGAVVLACSVLAVTFATGRRQPPPPQESQPPVASAVDPVLEAAVMPQPEQTASGSTPSRSDVAASLTVDEPGTAVAEERLTETPHPAADTNPVVTTVETPETPKTRMTKPDAALVSNEVGVVRKAFEDLYSAAQADGNHGPLIEQLRRTQAETTDPVRRYALFLEAERLAIDGTDLPQALGFMIERCKVFNEDVLHAFDQVGAKLEKPSAERAQELFGQSIAETDQFLAIDDYAAARKLAGLALQIGKSMGKSRKSSAIDEASRLLARVDAQESLHAAYHHALEALREHPEEAGSHATIGRFLCWSKQRWDEGLPHLAKGDMGRISAVATRQIALERDGTADAAAMFAVACEWWSASKDENLAASERSALLHYASTLYGRILPKLTDPVEIRIATKRKSPR